MLFAENFGKLATELNLQRHKIYYDETNIHQFGSYRPT